MMQQDLVKSVPIDTLLEHIEAIKVMLSQIQTTAEKAKSIAKLYGLDIRDFFYDRCKDDQPIIEGKAGLERFMKTMETNTWNHIMQQSGFLTFMSTGKRKAWNNTIQDENTPELTKANIISTFVSLHESRHEMIEEGVIEIFRGLSWDYETNQPYKFGKRIIVTNLLDAKGYLNSDKCDRLDDLLRGLCKFDNKPEPKNPLCIR